MTLTATSKGKATASHEKLFSRPGYLIRRVHQLHVSMFFDRCEMFDITPVQYGILTILADGAPFDQMRLGLEVGIDRSTTSNVIKRLERRRLVRRRVMPSDKRARLVTITERGVKLLKAAQPMVEEVQEELLAPLPPEERQRFVQNLRKLIENGNEGARVELRLFKV